MLLLAEVQTLPVISVNFWQIVVSLVNLVLLFLIIKKFLFKPVKKLVESREKAVADKFQEAEEAVNEANESKKEWEEKRANAESEANAIIQEAADTAKRRADKILLDAEKKAEDIVTRAEQEAELERRKVEDDVKREIVEVSSEIAQKVLEREVNTDDHRDFIRSFIDKIGESDDGSK